jgi:hypothetical protein
MQPKKKIKKENRGKIRIVSLVSNSRLLIVA